MKTSICSDLCGPDGVLKQEPSSGGEDTAEHSVLFECSHVCAAGS